MNPVLHPGYRPEIDGLRAIAVLAVVLYHFDLPGIRSGFVGVDIFFVISGFLIGGILWSELSETGRIRLGRFYLRRVRRLAPAFFAVVAASMLAAWFVLLPFEFRSFGKEVIASSLWLSNVLFYREAGYFDIGAESRVLLHTWSLSVEEQFYLFLPLTLILLARLGARRRVIVAVLLVAWAASLLACGLLTPTRPVATFYLFHFRAWEMLTGVLLAIWLRVHLPGPRLALLLSWGGLALIMASLWLVSVKGFPGWQAILPVAGTAAVLWGTANTVVTRNPVAGLLALPAIAFVGLISYSLYLWHWPVLVLSRYWRGGYASLAESLAWLAFIMVLATLSWRYVEQPVRHSRRIGSVPLLGGALLAGGGALGLGALAYLGNGLPGRFPPEIRVHVNASSGFLQDTSRCTRPTDGPLAGIETCAIGPEGPPEVLIWGDSHLRAQMDGLALAAQEAGRSGLIVWHAGCPPLFGLDKRETAATPDQDRACSTDNRRIREALPALDGIRRVLLVGRWTYYAEGAGVGLDAHNLITLAPAAGSGLTDGAQADLFAQALRLTVDQLDRDGFEVFVLRQPPELPRYASPEIAREMAHGRLSAAEAEAMATVPMDDAIARTRQADAPIRQLSEAGRISLIDPWPRLCASDCSGMRDGQSLYFDNNHLTYVGSVALRDLFRPFLDGTGSEGGA